jgi:hypothetical protein
LFFAEFNVQPGLHTKLLQGNSSSVDNDVGKKEVVVLSAVALLTESKLIAEVPLLRLPMGFPEYISKDGGTRIAQNSGP